jgi:hypothetical protein
MAFDVVYLLHQQTHKTMKTHNGHRSWNAWNVSLWINNKEAVYNNAYETVQRLKRTMVKSSKGKILHTSARLIMSDLPAKTPDGAIYNIMSIKGAIEDMY